MKDQLQRTVPLKCIPNRIISLVPSQTELLYDLGLDEEVVGITKFCVHPRHWFNSKTRIGGTKKVNLEKVIALQPDLILANKEENTRADIEYLAEKFPVWVSDIQTFEQALNMIESVGALCGKRTEANQMLMALRNEKATHHVAESLWKDALYFIWRDPYMLAGCDTFIDEMMRLAGFRNLIHAPRYPILTAVALQHYDPAYVLLSSEPYPFQQKHILELQTIFPRAKVILVDGELFSWYGSRMLQSFKYFSALHEQLQ